MDATLPKLIDAFAGLRVTVIGDALLDSYLQGSTGRLCHEAPVPVVALRGRKDVAGGAANTAVNAHRLGAQVRLLSVIGADTDGQLLDQALRERGLDPTDLIADRGRQTLAKHRVMADGQMLVRFDQGTTAPLEPAREQPLLERFEAAFVESDAVIVSDYGYGILTPRAIELLGRLQRRAPRTVVVDSRRHLAAYRRAGVTAVKPNYAETLHLLGLEEGADEARAEWIARAGARILDRTGARLAAVTLDRDGALLLERNRPAYRTYAKAARATCACGAGDTFVAALTLALAAGGHPPAAVEMASAAAAVVVGKQDTADCSAAELHQYVADVGKFAPSAAQLVARLAEARQQGRRIVMTNGCFDILHRGHIAYLNQAKALGDVLVVGVNTDRSIQRLKGPRRPINPLDDRVQVLAALSAIDHIVAFDEETPCELVAAIRPDVFVKGGDYTRDSLPEAAVVEAYGGSVRILPYVDDRSTTKLIERIWQREATPPSPLSPLQVPGET